MVSMAAFMLKDISDCMLAGSKDCPAPGRLAKVRKSCHRQYVDQVGAFWLQEGAGKFRKTHGGVCNCMKIIGMCFLA